MSVKGFVSLICEYNPFHFGHYYQLSRLKEEFDAVVCIMSGNIVQRGSVAVADKYFRAEAAIRSGADLVLELPVPWSCSSAKDFAAAGVHIAHAVGSETLAFGAEDDIELLYEVEKLFSKTDFHKEIKKTVEENKNLSYPAALTKLIGLRLGEDYGKALSKPNNILGLEYLLSMKNKEMNAFAVKRDPQFKSSSSIRAFGNGDEMLLQLPETSKVVFQRENGKDFPRNPEKLDAFYIGALRRFAYENRDISGLYGVTDDLLQRLLRESFHYSNVDLLISACTDKIYTSARIRRALNSIVFGITTEKVHAMPPYTCLLGATEKGREILKSAKKLGRIDIITKPVRALSKGEETKNAFLFAKNMEDIVAMSTPISYPTDLGKTPFILK